jgi:acetyltransferase
VRAARPDVELRGFTVEPMVDTADGLELIVGASAGGDFGPVIMFGEGGTAVEVTADTAVELPPLNLRLAHELIARTRVARKMRGYRHKPPIDNDAVALTLTRVAQLVIDFAQVLEIDVNPLLATPAGVHALDARIRITRGGVPRAAPLAIRPYPQELETDVTLADGRTFRLRPILPEDEPALAAAFARLSASEIRARFFVPMKTLPHLTAARFTQIDYDREMALVLADAGVPGKADIHAVVRLIADPDNRAAEFAIVVEKALTGLGLGTLLMRRLIDYGRSRGLRELFADVLADNAAMRSLARSLGFVESQPGAAQDHVVRVSLALDKYIPQ